MNPDPTPIIISREALDAVNAAQMAPRVVPVLKSHGDKLAADLANALWEVSALRHGLFTPHQFRKICERVIAARLNHNAEGSRAPYDRLVNAALALRAACKDRLPPGHYAKIDEECRDIDAIFLPKQP